MVALQDNFPILSRNIELLCNIEAEELILGGCLFDPNAFKERQREGEEKRSIADFLRPEHFYLEDHQKIFRVILDIHKEGNFPDLILTSNRLEEMGILEDVGGIGRLAQFVERTVSTANIDRYAAIVVEKWNKRQIHLLAEQAIDSCYYPEMDSHAVYRNFSEKIAALDPTPSALTPSGGKTPLALGVARARQILNNAKLTETEINIQLEEVRQELKIGPYDWKHNYILLIKREIDNQERIDIRGDLETITQAKEAFLDLYDILPSGLATPIFKMAEWLNLRPETYVTALLCACSALHSPKTSLILNQDYDFEVSPNLFGGIVAPSSQKKSPVIKTMISKPLSVLQRQARESFNEDLETYKKRLEYWENLKANKDSETLKREFPEGKPQEPKPKYYFFTNATTEGMIKQFKAYPDQGMLYLKDELAGAFKSFNMYRQGKGSDQEDFLSYYDSTGTTTLRGNDEAQASIDGVLLSLFGTIQPKVLEKMIGSGDDDNGLWSRFLFVNQPMAPSFMDSDGGSFSIQPRLVELYSTIAGFPPQTYYLSFDAFKAFCNAYNEFEKKRCSILTHPAMAHVWGKSEGRIGKLALNLHCIEWACSGQVPPPQIEVHTIKAAIELTEFYAAQIQGLYAGLEDSLPSNLAKTLELADRKGDWISAREVFHCLSSSLRKATSTEEIRSWFKNLADLGKGMIEGAGRELRFRLGHNGHNGHNAPPPKEDSKPMSTSGNSPDVANVANVANVVTFMKKEAETTVIETQDPPFYEVGETVEVNTSKGWEKGEVVDHDERGLPKVQIKGKNARVHVPFNWDCIRVPNHKS